MFTPGTVKAGKLKIYAVDARTLALIRVPTLTRSACRVAARVWNGLAFQAAARRCSAANQCEFARFSASRNRGVLAERRWEERGHVAGKNSRHPQEGPRARRGVGEEINIPKQ